MEISVHLTEERLENLRSEVGEGLETSENKDSIRLRKCLKMNNWDVESLKIVQQLLKSSESQLRVHALLQGAKIQFPKPEELPPRNPELEARIGKIKRNLENEEYKRMTENVDCGQRGSNPREKQDSFGQELRGMNRQLTMVLNTVLTVGSCFFFVYKGVGFMYPELADGAAPVIFAVLAAFVVLLADLYFIAKSIS